MKNSGRLMKTVGRAAIAGMAAALLTPHASAEDPYELVWAKLIGTPDVDLARGVTLDAEGNVIICGVSRYGSAGQEGLLAKVTQTGTLLWQGTGAWNHNSLDVAVDSAGSIYTAGAQGEWEEGFLRKDSASGSYLWEVSFSTYEPGEHAWCTAVAVDSGDNVYVSGYAMRHLPGFPAGDGEMFIVKYDTAGNRIWARQDVLMLNPAGMAVDSVGNVIVGGGEGSEKGTVVLAKYTPSGDRLWVREIRTSAEWLYSRDITLDAEDNVYFVGGVQPDEFDTQLSALLMKIDANGDLVWSRQYDPSLITYEYWAGVAVDAAGNAYVAGASEPPFGYEGPAVMRLAKYDSSGALLWLDTPDIGARSYSASGAVIDSAGNLFVSGCADQLFGVPAAGESDALLARFRPACYADCDGSGATDFFDFLCFQNAFAAADPYADCDGTGALDFFDFLCFQNAFATGCPE